MPRFTNAVSVIDPRSSVSACRFPPCRLEGAMRRSKDVDAWFDRYDNPMKAVVERVRAIVLRADPRIDECIKWQAPTFTYRGNLASFYPKSKRHAALMFHLGAKIPGKHPRLEGTGATTRVMKIGSVDEANDARRDIERIVNAWCDWRDGEATGTNRAGSPATTPSATKRAIAARKKTR
jgi:uncharacterized protein YdhG (YjbR/CyaY superfamily)